MEHTVGIDGAATHYWEYHPSKKPTLILIHGFRGTHHGLLKIAGYLQDYRLIIPDLPGFGASEPLQEEHSIEHYERWLNHFIKALHESPTYLVGHSFGSIIVSHFAAHHPEMVTKLVLINPIGAPALQGEHRLMTNIALWYFWLGRKLPDAIARAWISCKPATKVMSITMRRTNDRAIRAYIDQQHYQHFSQFANPTQLAEAFKASVSYDVSQVAKQLSMPTLLIAGEQDTITSLPKQRDLDQMIRHSTLIVIHGTGHLTHYETPDQVAAAIQHFVA